MKKINDRHLFWLGLCLKLAALPFFGSTYMRDLFIPFLDNSVLNLGANPWSLSPPHFFPYGSVLFVILFIPRYLATLLLGPMALGQTAWSFILLKGPLLLLDLMLLKQFLSFNPKTARQVMLYYWLNPVLFYISYVHGQLDVAAMTFCLMSIFAMLRGRTVFSACAMAMATLCKFHVILIIPLMMAYQWNNEFLPKSLRKILIWMGVWFFCSLAGFLPIIFAQQISYVTTSSPQALSLLGVQLPLGPEKVLFLGVMIVLLMLGRLCLSTRINAQGVLFGSGILFGTLVLVTDSMQGWYFWVTPFIALFYASFGVKNPLLYWLYMLAYLAHFVAKDYLPGLNAYYSSALFTALQTLLLAILVELWVVAVRTEMPLLGRVKPVLIGIAGNSGVGKNTLSQALQELFGQHNTLILEGDDYHRWERGEKKWDFYTHLDPKANLLNVLSTHAKELVKGRFVYHPHYDHASGTFTMPKEIRPNRTIVIQGLHALYLHQLRAKFDLKVFLAPEEEVRSMWKLERDTQERGYPPAEVKEQIAKRETDSMAHIEPQRRFADWIVEVFLQNSNTVDKTTAESKKCELGVRHILWNDAPIHDLCQALVKTADCKVTIRSLETDINKIVLQITGEPSSPQIERIASVLFPHIRQLTRSRWRPCWQAGLTGINQLIALVLIEYRLE